LSTHKLRVRKGDRVLILSGKDEGKKAKIISSLPRKSKVLVEGVNMIKKHARPTQRVPQGGIREIEAPIPSSKVMLICPSCQQPTRVFRRQLPDGKSVRACKKCSENIDK